MVKGLFPIAVGVLLLCLCIAPASAWCTFTVDDSSPDLGDSITFSGTCNAGETNVYMILTGPNMPSEGANMNAFDLPNSPVYDGVPTSFLSAPVVSNAWSVTWSTQGRIMDPGTYTVYGETAPESPPAVYATISLVPKRKLNTGEIKVETSPLGAAVMVDGSYVAGVDTPCQIHQLSATSHTVRVTKSGYFEAERGVPVVSGATSSESFNLETMPPVDPDVEDALNTVYRDELGYDTTGVTLSAYPNQLFQPTVNLWAGNSISFRTDQCHLVAIDRAPDANWEHPVSYICVDQYGSMERETGYSPPVNYQMVYALGILPSPGEFWIPDDPYIWKQSCVNDASNNYALLISGGKDRDNNFIRYWNDIAFMYINLIEYGYDPGHITVLVSDGSDPTQDRLIATSASGNQYDSSPLDLDGNGAAELVIPASKSNILATLDSMAPGGSKPLPAGANLVIFTTGHGGWDGVTGNNNAYIYAYGGTGTGQYIRDTEFVPRLNALTQVRNITLIMENCFSGGFRDDFIITVPNQKRVIMTAANGNEWSWGNGFSNAVTTGIAGHTRYYKSTCTIPTCPADVDKGADQSPVDERVSASEGFNYAIAMDPYAASGTEHPQFGSNAGTDTSTQFMTECRPGAPQKIFVLSPVCGERWQQDTDRLISWDAVGLADKNVKISLYKSGVLQSPVIANAWAAKNGTYKWRVPVNQALSTAYTIKVEAIGASVSNTSRTFAITTKPATNYGSLQINTVDETGTALTGAAIILDETPTGFLTPKLLTNVAPLGIHNVSLTLAGYYSIKKSNVEVVAGTKTYTIPMQKIQTGANGEPLDFPPYGGLDITSSPDGARVWIGRSGADPQDYQLETPAQIELMPGDYTVFVTKDEYTPSEKKTITVVSYTPERVPVKVFFDLTSSGGITTPEFPSGFLPAALVIAMLGTVIYIRRTRNQ